jgi:hypothetical protein
MYKTLTKVILINTFLKMKVNKKYDKYRNKNKNKNKNKDKDIAQKLLINYLCVK